MEVQDLLLKLDWSTEKVVEHFKEKDPDKFEKHLQAESNKKGGGRTSRQSKSQKTSSAAPSPQQQQVYPYQPPCNYNYMNQQGYGYEYQLNNAVTQPVMQQSQALPPPMQVSEPYYQQPNTNYYNYQYSTQPTQYEYSNQVQYTIYTPPTVPLDAGPSANVMPQQTPNYSCPQYQYNYSTSVQQNQNYFQEQSPIQQNGHHYAEAEPQVPPASVPDQENFNKKQTENSLKRKLEDSYSEKLTNGHAHKNGSIESPVKSTISSSSTNLNESFDSPLFVEKKRKIRKQSSSGEEDDDDGKPKQQVFNSDDDSDCEYTDFMTKDKRAVYEFFNNATVTELLAVKSCTQKKIDVIIENRPYRNWLDMKTKFQTTKPLQPGEFFLGEIFSFLLSVSYDFPLFTIRWLSKSSLILGFISKLGKYLNSRRCWGLTNVSFDIFFFNF